MSILYMQLCTFLICNNVHFYYAINKHLQLPIVFIQSEVVAEQIIIYQIIREQVILKVVKRVRVSVITCHLIEQPRFCGEFECILLKQWFR